ncbi:hypothetical protein ABFA07_004370 [Porites harrisoni]
MPVPAKCITDDDCVKGEAVCLRGECHCTNPLARGDGRLICDSYLFYRCPPYHEKRCSSNPPLYTNAHCIWSYKVSIEVVFCKCNEGHFGMAGVLGCLKAAEDPDGKRPCLGDQYCPPLAFCNSKTKRCQCRHGLVGNGVTCRPAPGRTGCKSNSDCKVWAECTDGTCHCRAELQGDGNTCNKAPRKKCKATQDCHPHATCMNGHCVCSDMAGNGEYCRKQWLPCVKNWCGLNDHCAMDPIHPQHHWCLCRIGTDEHGNCVECFTDGHCGSINGRCIRNKCHCQDELILSHSRCIQNKHRPVCKKDNHCHSKAKCEDGRCMCQGRTVGNGEYCRDAKDCPKNWLGMCKKFGDFGECVGEPLNPLGNGHCKCYKGYYDLFPRGCVECQKSEECASNAYCDWFACKCKDELIKKGKQCLPAPVQKCKQASECHPKAKCFFGNCICQGSTTGNGKFCRDAVPCSNATLLLCGGKASCLADPLLPQIPICRCHKGFRLSKNKTCEDIDECKTLKARCGNRCRNTVGSYYCDKCPRGFTEGRDGVCIASDECDCEENEECYEGDCYCAEGYDRDEFGKCVSMDNGLLLSGAQSIQVPFFHEFLILFILSANLAMLVEFL